MANASRSLFKCNKANRLNIKKEYLNNVEFTKIVYDTQKKFNASFESQIASFFCISAINPLLSMFLSMLSSRKFASN